MLRGSKRRATTEREVPAWKLALQRGDDDDDDRPVRDDDGDKDSSCADCRAGNPHLWTSRCE